MLIRAAGPALIPLNVTGPLPNPTLELHDAKKSNAVIATNDDWSSDSAVAAQIEAAAARTGAFAWTRGSKDAAILKTLDPGSRAFSGRLDNLVQHAKIEAFLKEPRDRFGLRPQSRSGPNRVPSHRSALEPFRVIGKRPRMLTNLFLLLFLLQGL